MTEQEIHELAERLLVQKRYANNHQLALIAASELLKQKDAEIERLRKKLTTVQLNFTGIRKLEPPTAEDLENTNANG